MPKDQDVLEFAQKVGAKEPEKGTELYTIFRSIFPRSNYFFLKDKVLIIKISRSQQAVLGRGQEVSSISLMAGSNTSSCCW